jgi:hypothetical protein
VIKNLNFLDDKGDMNSKKSAKKLDNVIKTVLSKHYVKYNDVNKDDKIIDIFHKKTLCV